MKLKKLLAVILSVMILFGNIPFATFIASAETSGYYTYTVSDGKVTITDCSTSISGNVIIPLTLGGYPITKIGVDAFYNCANLESIIIPNGVISIGEDAFKNCTSLKNITIPDNVTSIDSSVFYGCSSLESITIPNTVTSIGSSVFYGCSSLESITIPDSVTSIGDSAFSECTSLESITIPDSVTSIGDSAFSECTSLTSITIPDSVIHIGLYAFENCRSLTSITIPDGVTYIHDDTFSGCTSLTSITIPHSVTGIGNYAFFECKNLKSITIPNSVTYIGEFGFYGCTSLTSVVLSNSVNTIGWNAFFFCENLKNVYYCGTETGWEEINKGDGNDRLTKANRYYHNFENNMCIYCGRNNSPFSYTKEDGEITITGYDLNVSEIVIPNTIENLPVTRIGTYAFEGSSALESIIIPDTVTIIDSYAFYGCSNLAEITIPNCATSIGDYAFYGCSSLENITIPNTVTNIGNYVFSGCINLKRITVPGNIINVNDFVFENCTSLEFATISGDVTSIGDCVFSGCTSLKSIILPNSVKQIGWNAFFYCKTLQNVYYCGTENEWEQISIENGNDNLINANRYYHDYGEWIITENATCTRDGQKYRICAICQKKEIENIFAYGHSFGNWVIEINPTCYMEGEKYRICSICDEKETEIISAIGHDYKEEFTVDKQATDFEDGSKSRHCSICDSVTDITEIPRIASGKCGDNVIWKVSVDGTMYIDGIGAIRNYGTFASVPWYSYSDMITAIEIGEQITAIGHYAFNSLKNLETVKCGNADITFSKYYVFGISNMVFYGLGGSALENYTMENGYTLIKPKNPETPIAPKLLYKNTTSVTLIKVDGYEYSIDGVNYQESNIFNNLLPDSEYVFYQRIAENVYGASVASEGLKVSTAKMPSKPQIESIIDNTVIIAIANGHEYSLDLTNWQTSNTFSNLEFDKKYKIYTRVISTNYTPNPTIVESQEFAIASAPEIKLIGATKLAVKNIEGYEYSVDGIIWQSSNVFDKLVPDFEYNVYQRYAGFEFCSAGTRIITNGQDVNSNPSAADIVLLIKELLSSSNQGNFYYDYNGDNEVNVIDLVRLKRFLAGIDILPGLENIEEKTAELLSQPAYLEQKNIIA